MNDFLLHGNIAVALYSNMSTFRESIKSFQLARNLLKTMTNYKFNVENSNPQDGKRVYEFAKEMKIDIKKLDQKF